MTRPRRQLCPTGIFCLRNFCSTTGCLSLAVCGRWLLANSHACSCDEKLKPNMNSYFSCWPFDPTSSVLPHQNPSLWKNPWLGLLKGRSWVNTALPLQLSAPPWARTWSWGWWWREAMKARTKRLGFDSTWPWAKSRFYPFLTCDPGQVKQPLWTSVSPVAKLGW